MRRFVLLAATLGAACQAQPPVIAVRNLERPSDMGFLCVAVTDGKLTGRPMTYCHPRPTITSDPVPALGVGRPFGTFGLIPNTARGELAVADMDPVLNVLVDLDRTQPGYNMVPLGVQPEVIAVSQDGCRAVTANHGSCDLALVDPQRMLAPYFGVASTTGEGDVVTRVSVKTSSGVLDAAPAEIAFLPQPLSDLQSQISNKIVCSDKGVADNGPYEPRPWRAVVTFPGCDLVAMVELPSGKILSSVYIRPEGAVDAGTNPVCPSECGAASARQADAGGPVADAGAGSGDGGAAASGRLLVGALAVRPDGRRLYVGATNAPFLTALDVDPPVPSSVAETPVPATEVPGTGGLPGQTGSVSRFGLFVPADGGRIPLHENPGGVTRLRLSVDPYTVVEGNRTMGAFVGSRGEFLYAFARDGSMRLLSVAGGGLGGKEQECEANADPLFVTTQSDCYPLEGPNKAPRRPLVQGPGIHLPWVLSPDLPPPIPRDISFASVNSATGGASPAITAPDIPFNGAFGYVLTSTNAVYLLNVQPSTQTPEVLNHTFVNSFRGDLNEYPPFFSNAPLRDFTVTEIPLPVQVTPPMAARGPRLEGFPDLDNSGNLVTFWAGFPDPAANRQQVWQLFWEGTLPGMARVTGTVKAPATAGSAGSIVDVGADYCAGGVLPDDILLLPGCNVDADCVLVPPLNPQNPPPPANLCRQALPGTPGLCFPAAVANDESLLAHCNQMMGSRRRYSVSRAGAGELQLALKPDEIPLPSITPCAEDTTDPLTGKLLAMGNCRLPGFRCMSIRPGEPARCLNPCNAADASSCRAGMVCENVPEAGAPLCVEGPPIDEACWPAQASYRVQVHQAFLISGPAHPRPPVTHLENGQCVQDTARHRLLVNRIPLSAPACQGLPAIPPPPDANLPDLAGQQMRFNNFTKQLVTTKTVLPAGPPGTWGNPCLFKDSNHDEPGDISTHVKALFENQELKLVLTNLDEYGGDVNNIQFAITGGFNPATVALRDENVIITAGARITVGPTAVPESPNNYGFRSVFPYVYVVDQGRSAAISTGRGQILRIDTATAPAGIPVFDSTSFTSTPFQIQ
jgi:hypothetical protein